MLVSHSNQNRSVSLHDKISSKIGKGVEINRSLCFYSPREVFNALSENEHVRDWLTFISSRYLFPKKEILLIYPCSTTKPYNKSQSYKQLFKTLERLPPNKRDKIHLVTISEPFGLVPSEFYDRSFMWYDCPGLFEWWCQKNGTEYDVQYLDRSIAILADYVGQSVHRAIKKFHYRKVIGFVRTYSSSIEKRKDHTHRRILEQASQKFGLDIELLPNERVIRRIVNSRGHFAWDMYGPGHPIAQDLLFKYLSENA